MLSNLGRLINRRCPSQRASIVACSTVVVLQRQKWKSFRTLYVYAQHNDARTTIKVSTMTIPTPPSARFSMKLLAIAIASAGLATSTAQAVNVSSDGRGQVLLYPYYTTRNDNNGNAYGTLLSVVNATPSAKAVRVRFLEGKNSREVLDFNLFLSPFDVWT